MILRMRSGPLYFEVAGDGPPLAFVSGWALSSEYWRPVAALLKKKYRCLIYDSRGIGRSQPISPAASFQVDDHAEDLHSILEAAGIFDATIVGHEIGALVAAVCADQHPQDARSLVLVSPRATVQETEIRKLALFTPAALALRELAAYPLIRNLLAWRFRRAPQPYRDTLFNDFAELNPRAAYETALSIADSFARLDEFVKDARSAALIVCGEKDKQAVAQSRRLFSLAPAAKLATMRDCGFLPMLEYPQQFARLIDEFVAASTQA